MKLLENVTTEMLNVIFTKKVKKILCFYLINKIMQACLAKEQKRSDII